ncbi:MAG: hypothetical protein ACF8Q5_01415 [Phycisphaerales bacterium JB040]
MSLAEGILWFLSTFVGCYGTTLIVRGLRGEGIRKKWKKSTSEGERTRYRPTWRLVGLGVLGVFAGVGFFALAYRVHQIYGGFGWLTQFHMLAAGIGLFGVTLLTYVIIGDRAKGRKRCPRCWYNLDGSGLEQFPATCSECGNVVRELDHLYRPRRSTAGVVFSLILLLLAGVGWYAGNRYGRTGRIAGLVPDWIVLRLYFDYPDLTEWVETECELRLDSNSGHGTSFDEKLLRAALRRIRTTDDIKQYGAEISTSAMYLSYTLENANRRAKPDTQKALADSLPIILQHQIDAFDLTVPYNAAPLASQLRQWFLPPMIGENEAEEAYRNALAEVDIPEGFFQVASVQELGDRIYFLSPAVPIEFYEQIEFFQDSARLNTSQVELINKYLQGDPRLNNFLLESLNAPATEWGDAQLLALDLLKHNEPYSIENKLRPMDELDRTLIDRVRITDLDPYKSFAHLIPLVNIDPTSCRALVVELIESRHWASVDIASRLIGTDRSGPLWKQKLAASVSLNDPQINRFLLREFEEERSGNRFYGSGRDEYAEGILPILELLQTNPDTEIAAAAEVLHIHYKEIARQAILNSERTFGSP